MARQKSVPPSVPPAAAATRGEGRDDILNAALKCFAESGFEGTSIADIARAAGVGHPLVHYHFGSKDALWREAVVHAFKDLAVADSSHFPDHRLLLGRVGQVDASGRLLFTG